VISFWHCHAWARSHGRKACSEDIWGSDRDGSSCEVCASVSHPDRRVCGSSTQANDRHRTACERDILGSDLDGKRYQAAYSANNPDCRASHRGRSASHRGRRASHRDCRACNLGCRASYRGCRVSHHDCRASHHDCSASHRDCRASYRDFRLSDHDFRARSRGCRACNLGYIGLEVGLQRVQVRAQRQQSRLLRPRAGLLRLQVRWQRLQSRPQARRGLGQETAQSKDARPHAARSAQKSKHDRREVSHRSQDEPKQAPPPTGQPTFVTGAIPLSANVLSVRHWDRLLQGRLLAHSPRVDWATLLRRCFAVDVLECAKCHGRLRMLGEVTEPALVSLVLESLALPTEAPRAARARDPTELLGEPLSD
jgi:hypothetical protein